MTSSIYILGGPGSGKSTLMARLLEPWSPGPYVRLTSREMFGHYLLNDDLEVGLYLGHLRPEYPGTDALSLSVAPQALIWLENLEPSVGWVFGEGARLGHPRFLSTLSYYTDLLVVHLLIAPVVAAERRAARGGKQLTEQYCKTATTRAASSAQACRDNEIEVVELDGSRSVEELISGIENRGV